MRYVIVLAALFFASTVDAGTFTLGNNDYNHDYNYNGGDDRDQGGFGGDCGPQPVPEPATLVLLGAGSVVMGICRKKFARR